MKRLLVLSFLVLFVSGCKSSFTEVSREVKSSNISFYPEIEDKRVNIIQLL